MWQHAEIFVRKLDAKVRSYHADSDFGLESQISAVEYELTKPPEHQDIDAGLRALVQIVLGDLSTALLSEREGNLEEVHYDPDTDFWMPDPEFMSAWKELSKFRIENRKAFLDLIGEVMISQVGDPAAFAVYLDELRTFEG